MTTTLSIIDILLVSTLSSIFTILLANLMMFIKNLAYKKKQQQEMAATLQSFLDELESISDSLEDECCQDKQNYLN